MIRKQSYTGANPLSTFYVVHNFTHTPADRYKQRQRVGPYVCTRPNACLDSRMMYQANDMQTGDGPIRLRLQWCDDIINVPYRGYFVDDNQDETYRGVVARLPASRGFLAGFSMGAGMIMRLDTDLFDDIESAAHCADSMADNAAQIERDS